MIKHTNSFKILKKEMQEIFDFVVTVSYAVPSLKMNIKLVEGGLLKSLPTADHFSKDTSSPSDIRKRSIGYKNNMSKYLLISSFSFFESYIKNVFEELLIFHEGGEKYVEELSKRLNGNVNLTDSNIIKNKKKLQEYHKGNKIDTYKKHTKLLVEQRYKFPSELFAYHGLISFIKKSSNFNAVDIPSLLNDMLLMNLDGAGVQRFHDIRDMRNKIAHGDKISLNLRKVIDVTNFLRSLAITVDQHLIQNFFIIENYV